MPGDIPGGTTAPAMELSVITAFVRVSAVPPIATEGAEPVLPKKPEPVIVTVVTADISLMEGVTVETTGASLDS